MAQLLYGSICLSDIPRDMIKAFTLKDGTTKKYLNISIHERKEQGQYGDTHFISCAPKKEERKEGVKYIIGDLKTWNPEPTTPSYEQVEAAPTPATFEDLPF